MEYQMTKIVCTEDCIGRYSNTRCIKNEIYEYDSGMSEGTKVYFIFINSKFSIFDRCHFKLLSEHRDDVINEIVYEN